MMIKTKFLTTASLLSLSLMSISCTNGMSSTTPVSSQNSSSGGGSSPTTTMPPSTTSTTTSTTTTLFHGGSTTTTTLHLTTTTTTMLPPTTTTTLPSSGGGYGFFPAGAVWSQDISKAALDSQSATIINWLSSNGGWGTGRMQVDTSINILYATSVTPYDQFIQNSGYYSPDCDNLTTFPVPVGGAVEGNPAYACNDGGDCHMLVVDTVNHKLYESYQSSVSSNQVHSTCGVLWDLNKIYPASGRGDQCTSTDAAGYPVAPLLFTADELKAGVINHAIRFILPNARIAKGIYVHPATHVGGPSGPTASAVPYGAHFRLKSTFNVSTLKPAAQVVARAMQKYGMFLSDGGNIALTAANDAFTVTKYTDVDFTPLDLSGLQVTDFEMVDGGARITATGDCVRNP